MDKQKIFDEMIDNILSCVTISEFNTGELIIDKDQIFIKDSFNKLHYFAYVPYELEGEKIHGNTRNAIAKEFINQYSFSYLKGLFNKKIEAQQKHLQLEKQNRHKLNDLYSSISYLEKYNNNNRYNFNGGVKFFHGFEKYCIEFSCSKDNYSSDNIQIYNNPGYEKFDFKFNYKTEELTKDEIIYKIKNLSEVYEKIFQEKKVIEEAKKLKEQNKIKLQNKISEIYSLGKEVLFKNKKSFIGFRNGLRYAVGEGKVGKYYRCDYSQLYNLITKKGITEYTIISEKVNTYRLSNEELKNLKYVSMV